MASTERVASKPTREARANVKDEANMDGVERAAESEGVTVLGPVRTVDGRESRKFANDATGDDKNESSCLAWVTV